MASIDAASRAAPSAFTPTGKRAREDESDALGKARRLDLLVAPRPARPVAFAGDSATSLGPDSGSETSDASPAEAPKATKVKVVRPAPVVPARPAPPPAPSAAPVVEGLDLLLGFASNARARAHAPALLVQPPAPPPPPPPSRPAQAMLPPLGATPHLPVLHARHILPPGLSGFHTGAPPPPPPPPLGPPPLPPSSMFAAAPPASHAAVAFTGRPLVALGSTASKTGRRRGRPLKHHYFQGPDGRFHCPVCNNGFSRRFALVRHLKSHDAAALTCSVCKVRFADRNAFSQHTRLPGSRCAAAAGAPRLAPHFAPPAASDPQGEPPRVPFSVQTVRIVSCRPR
jgi:hypothetical protein